MYVAKEPPYFKHVYRNIAIYKCYFSDTDSLYSCVYKDTYRIRAYRFDTGLPATHTNNNCRNLFLKYEVHVPKSILNVHGESDNYLSCSKRASPTWLDSYINIEICHIAVLKHTLNTNLSPLTYTVHFIVVCTNITIVTIHFISFSENESNRYNKYTFN